MIKENISLDEFTKAIKEQLKKVEIEYNDLVASVELESAIKIDLDNYLSKTYPDYLYENRPDEYFKKKEELIKSSKLYESEKDNRAELDYYD